MGLLRQLINLYVWVLILAALLSWFPDAGASSFLTQTKQVVARLTEPVLQPLRQILPRVQVGGASVDFSVFAAIIVLRVVSALL
jgi:YggT family protein